MYHCSYMHVLTLSLLSALFLREKNALFLLQNESNLTHEFLYNNFNAFPRRVNFSSQTKYLEGIVLIQFTWLVQLIQKQKLFAIHCLFKFFQESCRLFAEQFGETAPECAESYFYYGRALLELARIENGVLGNALEGGNDLSIKQVKIFLPWWFNSTGLPVMDK